MKKTPDCRYNETVSALAGNDAVTSGGAQTPPTENADKKEAKKLAVSNFNLPNVLTVARLVLVPVFIWLMFMPGPSWRWAALIVFMVAAATDKLDGTLARSWNLVTDFGKLADPIADKSLVIAALVLLSWEGTLPWWVTAVIILRELGITVLRFFMLKIAVIPASKGGKLKTVLQMLMITLMLVPWDNVLASSGLTVMAWTIWVIMWLAVAVTVITGLDYLWGAWKLARDANKKSILY